MDWLRDLATLLAAGGAGGVIAKWVGDSNLRREARARLLAGFYAVFDLLPDASHEAKTEAMNELMRGALVAGVPAKVFDRFRGATLIAINERVMSTFTSREISEFDAIYELSSRALVRWIWNPWLSRPRNRRRLRDFDSRLAALDDECDLGLRDLADLPLTAAKSPDP